MLRQTVVRLKNPYVYKYGNSAFTTQLKRLLQKNHVHRMRWDPLPMYNPRRLAHTNKQLDHYSYSPRYNPHAAAATYSVPDQEYNKIPVPVEFRDAYWWRDLQSRRIQCPISWVEHKMYSPKLRKETDFQNLAFSKKFKYGLNDVLSQIKDDLR